MAAAKGWVLLPDSAGEKDVEAKGGFKAPERHAEIKDAEEGTML